MKKEGRNQHEVIIRTGLAAVAIISAIALMPKGPVLISKVQIEDNSLVVPIRNCWPAFTATGVEIRRTRIVVKPSGVVVQDELVSPAGSQGEIGKRQYQACQ